MNTPANGSKPEGSIVITLSAEEVYVILRFMRLTSIPGLNLDQFELDALGVPSEPERRALAAATDALIANGTIEPAPTTEKNPNGSPRLKFNLPADVVALLGACAYSPYVLRLGMLTAAGLRDFYFHDVRHVGVAHTVPLGDIHKFTALPGRQGVLQYAQNVIGLAAQSSGTGTAYTLSEAVAFAARDAALTGKRDAAVRALLGAGLALPAAEEFVTALSGARGFGGVTIRSVGADGAMRELAFGIVAGESVCFLLAPEYDTRGTQYHIQAVSAQQALQFMSENLPAESDTLVGVKR